MFPLFPPIYTNPFPISSKSKRHKTPPSLSQGYSSFKPLFDDNVLLGLWGSLNLRLETWVYGRPAKLLALALLFGDTPALLLVEGELTSLVELIRSLYWYLAMNVFLRAKETGVIYPYSPSGLLDLSKANSSFLYLRLI